MAEHGYTPDQIRLTSQVYQVAAKAYSAHFRPSGKTFLSHLVGTASLLVQERLELEIVHAALLHALYSEGNESAFLYSSLLVSKSARLTRLRRRVVDLVGLRTESIIYSYHSWRWNPRAACDLCGMFKSLSSLDKAVLAIRVANECDEVFESKRTHHGRSYLDSLVEISELLDLQVLASLLRAERLVDDSDQLRQLLYELNNKTGARRLSSYFLMPNHCMLRPGIALVFKFRQMTGFW